MKGPEGRGNGVSCRKKLGIITPCHSLPITPIASSRKAKVFTLAHKTSMIYLPPPLSLTSCPFCSTPMTTLLLLKCTKQTVHSGLGTGCAFWGNSVLPPILVASPLTSLRFCSNVIFSVMPTLTFSLKIVACPHCW